MARRFILLLLCLAAAGYALASPGTASADVPLDMEHTLPLVWNPLGVQVYNVYWDSNWDGNNPGFSKASIDAATQALTQSDYFEKSAQYGVPGRNFTGSADALGICGSDPGNSVSIASIELFMACEKTAPLGGLPGDPQSIIFNLFIPARTTVDAFGVMCQDYAAFHTLGGYESLSPPFLVPVYFSVMPLACYRNGGISGLMSGVSHEDVEILTDPAVGLFWLDHDSAPPGLPSSLPELLLKAVTDPLGLFRDILAVNSEASDICEKRAGFPTVPGDFQAVPESPFGIDMQLAAYWSNQDHACVVGNRRVVEATFTAIGPPAGAGTVLVDNFTRPIGYTHSALEGTTYSFAPSVTAGGHRYVAQTGCSGTVTFPDGNTTADAARTFTCVYRQQGTGPGAIDYSDGCANYTLPPNDDGSTDRVSLPFQPNFFGTTYTSLWVNNNGNVTFDGPMSTYTPFPLTTTNRPLIAPFFGDVDTRNPGSNVVTFGTTTFGGRTAFCVLWADVGVGYYYQAVDKLNGFQLLLVDRSDVGPGDFDIVMNYDQIQWETGDASGGQNGLGGSSARVGYSNGIEADSFELPGSAVNGALLDSSPSGLVHLSRNSTQAGRYIYQVRNGRPPSGGSIEGHVKDQFGFTLAYAPVQVCPSDGGACVWNGFTTAGGEYTATGLPDGTYNVTAFPPAGVSLVRETIGPEFIVSHSNLIDQDVTLRTPEGAPPGTSISPSQPGGGGVPVVYWRDTLTLTVAGCPGGTASYTILDGGNLYAAGFMSEVSRGVYSASVPQLYPNHGHAVVASTIHCTDGSVRQFSFDIYIDPSGTVRTPSGQPVEGASVALYRSDSASGPFAQVDNGSAIMSPANRSNPMTTDANGHFGWDVITGYYKVRVTKAGCHAPGNPAQDYVESDVVQVPPAVIDLDLRLDCPNLDSTPPTTTSVATPQPNAAGWNREDVTVELNAADEGGSGVATLSFSATGADAIVPTTVPADRATLHITHEGLTTISYYATDRAGNTETAHTLLVRLDKTAPVVATSRSPAANSNGWNNTDVTAHFAASDVGGSGIDGPATLDVVVSSEGANQSARATFSDVAGNQTTATVSGISIDKTAPSVTCAATPNLLWPPNHALVEIKTTVTVTDSLSGPGGFVLIDATSSEPDNGLGDGDTTGDIQGWNAGDADTSGWLRAERSGSGPGRTYTLRYRGSDRAGNSRTCAITVTVPHTHG